MDTIIETTMTLNGEAVTRRILVRQNLVDFLREEMGLTGTHVGCEHGVCGACTVRVDGKIVRGCLMLAVQADGCRVETIEGASESGELAELQETFHKRNALQCGFCTPGILMTFVVYLRDHPNPSEAEIREVLSGNLCRCTGYHNIVVALMAAARELRQEKP